MSIFTYIEFGLKNEYSANLHFNPYTNNIWINILLIYTVILQTC